MSLAEDRRYCREALPRVSRTFAINIRLLNGTLGEAVRVGYLLCRTADTIEDAWPGSDLASGFTRFLEALDGDAAAAARLVEVAEVGTRSEASPELELVAHLPAVLRVARALPAEHRLALREGVGTLAEGMARYATRAAGRPSWAPYLDDEAELEDYCWVVAGCVGVMLTRLHATTDRAGKGERLARRLALAPVVGQALQLTNILLDWPADLRRGRCYLPATWLNERGVVPSDLVGGDRSAALDLARRLEAKARAALARVPDYIDLLPATHLRYRLFCLWPALWAARSLAHARRDPEFPWGPRRPKLPRAEILKSSLGSLLQPKAGESLRRLATAAEP